MTTIAQERMQPGFGERRSARRGAGGCAIDYQRQVEMIMKAPRERRIFTARGRERLATGAVLLAIAVSLGGACIVIAQASADAQPQRSAAGR